MAMTSRDVLFMMRARDYASREVRALGGAFGALGKAIQKVDSNLQNNLNRSLERQTRMINQSKAAAESYSRTIDQRITASHRKEAAALSETSAASVRHSRALENNAYLTKLAGNSQKAYASQVVKANNDISSAAAAATREASRQQAADIEGSQEHVRSLQARNRAITAMQKSMAAGSADRQKALDFARQEMNQYRRNSDATSEHTKHLSKQQAAQARLNSASHQAYLTAKRHNDKLADGRFTQQQYSRARQQAWNAEKAINQETIGKLNTEMARRREVTAEQKRGIADTAAQRKAANDAAVQQQQRATDSRLRQLGRERTAEIERHQAHQQQIRQRAASERAMLEDSRKRYGENSRTHQQRLAETGAAQRRAFEEEAQRQRQSIQQYQRKIAQLQAVGIAATVTGAALVAMGRRGISAIMSMTRESIDFRQEVSYAMTQIQDDTPATIDGLVRMARTIGYDIPAAMDTMGSTLFFIFSSLRVNTQQATDLLEGFAKEAVAGSTDIESAARSTIAILNGMGMSVEELTRIQDMQFQTVRRGVITYEQLSSNIGKLIPALRRSGQEIETGGAMLAFLTRQGLSAEMATTAAARSLELIADPRVVSRLENMGITIRDDVTGEFVSLVDILTQMNDEFGGLPAPDRAQALLDIFGGAGYRIQARRFFDTVFANFDNFLWQIDEAASSAGAMERAYQIVFEQPQTQMQLFENRLTVLRQEFGENFVPVVMSAINVGMDLIDMFRDLDESTKETVAQFVGFGSVAAVVSGAFLLVGGVIATMTSLVAAAIGSIGGALAIVVGIPAAITAATGLLLYLAVEFDTISEAVQQLGRWLGLTEEQFTMFMTTIGLAGGTLVAFKGYMLVATGAAAAFIAKLKLMALANPILTTIAVLAGGVAAAIYLVGKEARQVEGYARDMGRAIENSMPAILASESALENYSSIMKEAARSTVEQTLAEQGLIDIMRDNPYLNSADYVDGILDVNGAYESQLAHLRDVQKMYNDIADEEMTGSFVQDLFNADLTDALSNASDVTDLITEYEAMGEAADIAMRRTVSGWRELGGLEGLIGDYIYYVEQAADAENDLPGGRGTYTGAQDALLREIEAVLGLETALDDLSPAMRQAITENGELNEVVQAVQRAYQDQIDAVGVLKPVWQSLSGVIDSVGDRYTEKLGEANEAAREFAEAQAKAAGDGSTWEDFYTEQEASIDLYREALAESTEELDWALSAQRTLRNTYGDDVRAWWGQMYQDEPELARQIYDELLEGDASLFEEMRANRKRAATFMVRDWKDGGLDLIDANGEIHDDMVDAVADALGVLPRVARGILEDLPEIAEEQADLWSEGMVRISTSGAQEAASAVLGELEPDEVTLNLLGDSWGREFLNGANRTMANATIAAPKVASPSLPRATYDSSGNFYGFTERNRGGLIPGRGPDRDTVPAMLTRGEFVLRRSAVDKLGPDVLHRLNNFNTGGPVGDVLGNHTGRDRLAIEGGFQTLIGRLSDIFHNRNVPIATYDETAEERLNRIATEVRTGYRTIDNVRGSVDMIQSASHSSGSAGGLNTDVTNWMPRAIDKYEDVMGKATEANMSASREMISAINAMNTHLTAQHNLADARNNVQDLEGALVSLEAEAIAANAALNDAIEESKKLTASQELAIISAQKNIRSAERAYDSFGNGVHDLNTELDQLRQEQRVEQLRKNYEDLKKTTSSDGTDSTFLGDLAAAQARLSAAKLEMDRVSAIAPTMQDEVQGLLLQFKAENELADAYKALNDLKDSSEDAAAGADELRIAEIELELGLNQLNNMKEDATYRSEDLRVAELQLTQAQEGLTQAYEDAEAPTQDMIDAQRRLDEIHQEQIDTSDALRQARRDLGSAELEAMSATLGLISAGQDLVEHGPDQLDFFEELALAVGMAEENVQDLMGAMEQLSGASADYGGAIAAHEGYDKIALEEGLEGTMSRIKDIFDNRRVAIATDTETELQRLTRIAHEVMSGQRSMNDVRSSVDRLQSLNIGTYDNGGILRPGWTLAHNATGQNEFITRTDSVGSGLTVESGAINVRIDGDATETTERQIAEAVERLLEDLYDQMRSE